MPGRIESPIKKSHIIRVSFPKEWSDRVWGWTPRDTLRHGVETHCIYVHKRHFEGIHYTEGAFRVSAVEDHEIKVPSGSDKGTRLEVSKEGVASLQKRSDQHSIEYFLHYFIFDCIFSFFFCVTFYF